jgi:hypothetical protein
LYQHTDYSKQGYLSQKHREMLVRDSAIDPSVALERGYKTVRRRSELVEFQDYQRRLGLYVPLYSPDGITRSAQIRPDKPRMDKKGKPIKYDTPVGARQIIDVHTSMRDRARSGCGRLWVTEGTKKGDALTSRGECVVVLAGVWNWKVKDTWADLLPCWDYVALDGREVLIVFDSDVMVKLEVQLALERLVEALEDRGAVAKVIYLPDAADGSKQGVDDYLAAGGTVEELRRMARGFQPIDIAGERLNRDDTLRALVEDLERTFWGFEWKGTGGHTARDVLKVAIDEAARSGKVHQDGVRITISQRTWARRTKVVPRTLGKAIARLEKWGLGYRDNQGRKVDKAGAFVLRAGVAQYGQREAGPEEAGNAKRASDRGVLPLRAPRLRWSSPRFKGRRGVVKGTRQVRQSLAPWSRPAVKRLGKIRGAILDALDAAGGTSTVAELCEVLHRSRPRDLRRRVLPMLEEARLISVSEAGDTVTLATDWLERLEEARELGGEIEAERRDRDRHRRESKAFRRRLEVVPNPAPTDEEMRERRERYPERRRRAIRAAIACLFAEHPEYRTRRVGQVTCALVRYLSPHFPRGPDGYPKDAEVEEILEGVAA